MRDPPTMARARALVYGVGIKQIIISKKSLLCCPIFNFPVRPIIDTVYCRRNEPPLKSTAPHTVLQYPYSKREGPLSGIILCAIIIIYSKILVPGTTAARTYCSTMQCTSTSTNTVLVQYDIATNLHIISLY